METVEVRVEDDQVWAGLTANEDWKEFTDAIHQVEPDAEEAIQLILICRSADQDETSILSAVSEVIFGVVAERVHVLKSKGPSKVFVGSEESEIERLCGSDAMGPMWGSVFHSHVDAVQH